MKKDGHKALTRSAEHREVAKRVHVCVAILGVILAGLEVMTWRAAFIGLSISIVYVMLLTRRYTVESQELLGTRTLQGEISGSGANLQLG